MAKQKLEGLRHIAEIALPILFKIWLKGKPYRVSEEIFKMCNKPGVTQDEILKLIGNKNN